MNRRSMSRTTQQVQRATWSAKQQTWTLKAKKYVDVSFAAVVWPNKTKLTGPPPPAIAKVCTGSG